MTIYAVEVFHLIHTCPGNPAPPPIDTPRTVVHLTPRRPRPPPPTRTPPRRPVAHVPPGGPCRPPITTRRGDTTTVVAWGGHDPFDRQCGNCRTIIHILTVTCRDLGYQGPDHRRPVIPRHEEQP